MNNEREHLMKKADKVLKWLSVASIILVSIFVTKAFVRVTHSMKQNNLAEKAISESGIKFTFVPNSLTNLICPESELVDFDQLQKLHATASAKASYWPLRYSAVRVREGYAVLQGSKYSLVPMLQPAYFYLAMPGQHEPYFEHIML